MSLCVCFVDCGRAWCVLCTVCGVGQGGRAWCVLCVLCGPGRALWWDGSGSLVQFVVSLNLHRRHLTSSQLAFVGVDILPHLEAEAKQRQETGNNQHSLRELIPQGSTGKSADQAADVVGSNGRYVSDAKKLQAEAPALAAQVRAGGKTITQAKRELKEQVRETRREDNRQKVASPPSSRYMARCSALLVSGLAWV